MIYLGVHDILFGVVIGSKRWIVWNWNTKWYFLQREGFELKYLQQFYAWYWLMWCIIMKENYYLLIICMYKSRIKLLCCTICTYTHKSLAMFLNSNLSYRFVHNLFWLFRAFWIFVLLWPLHVCTLDPWGTL